MGWSRRNRSLSDQWVPASGAEIAARRAEMARLLADPVEEYPDADPSFLEDLKLAQELMATPRRANSGRAYNYDEDDYVRYAEKNRFDPLGPKMRQFKAFFISLTRRKKRNGDVGLKFGSITRKSFGVDRYFRRHNLISPVGTRDFKDFMGRLEIKAAKRAVRKAKAFYGKVAEDVLDSLDIENERDARDCLILVAGSERGFRSETIVAMNLDRMKVDENSILLEFDTVKNIRNDGFVQFRFWHREGGPKRCAHCAILHVKELFGLEGPLLRQIDRWGHVKGPLGKRAITDILRKRVAAVGYDPSPFSSHGLRRGRFQIEWEEHTPTRKLMTITGTRSEKTIYRYIDEFEATNSAPTRALIDGLRSEVAA